MPAFGDYQNEIYFNGLRGVRPKLPVDFRRIEEKACAALPVFAAWLRLRRGRITSNCSMTWTRLFNGPKQMLRDVFPS